VKQSESIANLAASLAAAQGELKSIGKDRENSHFRNKYATLDSIMETVRPTLAKHGLSVIQGMTFPTEDANGVVRAFVLETMLLHKSGEFISNASVMPVVKSDPQGVGSAITYGRRYGVSALLALATDEDDDGNAAAAAPQKRQPNRAQPTAQNAAAAPAARMTLAQAEAVTVKGKTLKEMSGKQVAHVLEWAKGAGNQRLIAACEIVQADRQDAADSGVDLLDGSQPILEDAAA
jgi:hypothetical protein